MTSSRLSERCLCVRQIILLRLLNSQVIQKEWSQRSVEERVSAIEPFGSLIEAHLDELVEVLKTEQGMLDSVVRREVQESIAQIKHTRCES